MGYTSGATMDERGGLRDVEHWKDKIEVRLDNRQVFFLFFGSALVACLLFVLGVIVGKRLESRGRAVAPELEDPLALLDKVATVPRSAEAAAPAKTFLTTGAAPAKSVTTVAKPETKVEPKSEAPKPVVTKAAAPAPSQVASAAPAPKGHFALQVGSFPEKTEADTFAKRFGSLNAYVVASEIPGKGIWYRVRVGDYASAKDAIAAKSDFEKQNSVIAYVVGPK